MPHHPAPQSLPLPPGLFQPCKAFPKVNGALPEEPVLAAQVAAFLLHGIQPLPQPGTMAAQQFPGLATVLLCRQSRRAACRSGLLGARRIRHVAFAGHEPFQADMTQAGDIQDDFHVGTIDAPLLTSSPA